MKDNMRIPSLDGWRGIAILIVIIGHEINYRIRLGLLSKTSFWYFLAWHGYGVQAFFVISGFIITFLLLTEKKHNKINLKKFYLRRAFKIIPPLFTYLFILFLLSFKFHHKSITPIIWLKAIFFLTNFVTLGYSWSTLHLWSLAIEEQYYLFWPIVFPHRRFCTIISIFFIAIAPLLRILEYQYPGTLGGFSFFIRGDSLFIGSLFAIYYERIIAIKIRLIHYLILLTTFLCLLAEKIPIYIFSKLTIAFSITFFSLSIVILIKESLIKDSWLFVFFNTKPLVWIGKVSYSLYLWQPLFTPLSIFGFCFITKFPINFICMFFCAYVSYHFIEQPFLNLRKKIIQTKTLVIYN